MKNSKKKPEEDSDVYPQLEEVFGSSYCLYSTVENRLATLYKNQHTIYELLKNIDRKLNGLTPF